MATRDTCANVYWMTSFGHVVNVAIWVTVDRDKAKMPLLFVIVLVIQCQSPLGYKDTLKKRCLGTIAKVRQTTLQLFLPQVFRYDYFQK